MVAARVGEWREKKIKARSTGFRAKVSEAFDVSIQKGTTISSFSAPQFCCSDPEPSRTPASELREATAEHNLCFHVLIINHPIFHFLTRHTSRSMLHMGSQLPNTI